MTLEEIADAVNNITEGQVKKLNIRAWTAMELSRIVNRRKYWWRKKALSFMSVPNQATYDLSDEGLGIADDFLQMASNLFRWDSSSSQTEIPFQGDNLAVLNMINDTVTQGDPATFAIEPGTTKVLRLSPLEISARLYVGMYLAGVILDWSTPSETKIPLIPLEYHYVVLLAMQRRAFFYLYGQKDPRFAAAVADEQAGLKDLDEYRSPSLQHTVELRSSDPRDFVQSTG